MSILWCPSNHCHLHSFASRTDRFLWNSLSIKIWNFFPDHEHTCCSERDYVINGSYSRADWDTTSRQDLLFASWSTVLHASSSSVFWKHHWWLPWKIDLLPSVGRSWSLMMQLSWFLWIVGFPILYLATGFSTLLVRLPLSHKSGQLSWNKTQSFLNIRAFLFHQLCFLKEKTL